MLNATIATAARAAIRISARRDARRATPNTANSAATPASAENAPATTASVPTSTGRDRRSQSAKQAADPAAMSRTSMNTPWSSQVCTKVTTPKMTATAKSAESTSQSRAERAPGDSLSSPGSNRRCQRWMLDRSVAISAIAESVRPRRARGPRPKLISPWTAGAGIVDTRPYLSAPVRSETRGMIETQNITKWLGGRTVVDDVSFRVEPGTIMGFLGPNGAGKTTTLRMLTGLSAPDGGRALVLGGSYRELPNPGRRVGVLLDASAQHDGRRGREALAVSAQIMGVDPRRIDGLLELVGLDRSAARKRVRQYSLGMRQRLGIAHALLGDPEVLILDEPANGLDPPGMRWMRELLRDFADRGGTVLLSSHLLHEVEALADRLVIIDLGRIVAEGTRDELLARTGSLVLANDGAALHDALRAAGLTARPASGGGFVVEAEPDVVGRAALSGGVALTRLEPARDSGLEQLFFDLTLGDAGHTREEAA